MGLIISVSGRAEAGKSTCADAIVSHAASKGLHAKSFELSAYVLQYCIQKSLIANKTRKQLNKEELAIMVEVGESVRQSDPTMWVRRALKEIEDYQPDVSVVPNIRRQYEADEVRKAGGTVIKVVSLNKNGSEFISQTRDANNSLETDQYLIPADYFLTTMRGQPQLLKAYARTLFDHILSTQPKPQDTRQTEFDFAHA